MSRFGNLEFSGESREGNEALGGPPEGRSHIDEAQSAFEAGRFEQALRLYAKALEGSADHSAAWAGQVRMLIELGEFYEAKVWAEKALGHFPDDPDLLAAKGVALARLGDLEGALSFSDSAVEARASTPYVWLARGDVLLARGEKRAEYCFEKALALAANNWLVLWLAARIQAFHEHFATALKLARRALTLDPARAVLWIEIGRSELALGLADQARHSLAQARELDPDSPAPGELLGRASDTTFLRRLQGRWQRWFPR